MAEVALVTGAGGQDGGYLCEALVAQGTQVHGVVRAADQPVPWLDGVQLHDVDLRDSAGVAALVAEVAPSEIYNLAAISSVARSWADPVETAEVNGLSVAGLLEAADSLRRDGHPVRVLQASSSEIFAGDPRVPKDEHTPLSPLNPYGASKAYAQLLVDVYRRRGLFAASVILFGHESVRRPAQFVTRKITSTVAAIATGQADELRLGPLDVRRDWGWAPEYVDAMIRAIRHDQPDDFVLATGQGHSVAEFVEAAFGHAGIEDYQRYVVSDAGLHRPTDAPVQIGDAGKAGRILGWQPRTVFPEVVHKMVDADLAAART